MTSFKLSGAKSLFASKTFWGVILATLAALVPLTVNAIEEKKLSAKNGGAMVLVIIGALQAIVGRVSATEKVYTPDGLPGPNKQDLVEGDR
jgi:uncharacterized membrane protein (DUF441 family)